MRSASSTCVRAHARGVEFPLHFGAARFEAQLFRAERFDLPLMLRGLRRKLFLFLHERIALQGPAPSAARRVPEVRAAMRAAIVSALASRSASAAISARRDARSSCLACAFCRSAICCSIAWTISCSAPARALETSPRRCCAASARRWAAVGVIAQAAKLGLAVAQFDSEAHHVAARLIALQGGRHLELLRFDVLRGGLFESRLRWREALLQGDAAPPALPTPRARVAALPRPASAIRASCRAGPLPTGGRR